MMTMRLWIRGRLRTEFQIADVEDARCRVFRAAAENGWGFSVLGGADIYKNGKKVGRVSYNGRVWEAKKDGRELNDDLTLKAVAS